MKDCAVDASAKCAVEYGRALLSSPKLLTLCTAVPAKVSCLVNTAGRKCRDFTLRRLMAVFPSAEAASVLAELCPSPR